MKIKLSRVFLKNLKVTSKETLEKLAHIISNIEQAKEIMLIETFVPNIYKFSHGDISLTIKNHGTEEIEILNFGSNWESIYGTRSVGS